MAADALNLIKVTDGRYVSADELVEVYECSDGTWRVAYFPYDDKDRDLTREQAFSLAEERHRKAREIYRNAH